jgi:hypothetical protein
MISAAGVVLAAYFDDEVGNSLQVTFRSFAGR